MIVDSGDEGGGVMRSLLLSLLAILVVLSGSAAAADDYQSPMMKAQYAFLKSHAWTLSRESCLRFCNLNAEADRMKPTAVEQLPSLREASEVYVASGGQLSTDTDTTVFTTVLANSETPMDMGFRLGIGTALELLGISEEKFCEAFTAAFLAEMKAAESVAE